MASLMFLKFNKNGPVVMRKTFSKEKNIFIVANRTRENRKVLPLTMAQLTSSVDLKSFPNRYKNRNRFFPRTNNVENMSTKRFYF